MKDIFNDFNHLAIPTANLNGTSKNQLVQNLCKAKGKIEEAREALSEVCPHMRDYSDNDTYQKARHEHNKRQEILENLSDELYGLAIRINDK